MSVIYDGNFSNPTPIGRPKIIYPITNLPSLYFVLQRYAQLGSSYSGPSFGMSHHLYPKTSFCEETSFANKGGGLVEFEWKFGISGVNFIESSTESVTFPGFKKRKIPFTENFYVNTGTSSNPSLGLRSRTLYAYDVVLREPFSEMVECTQNVSFINIFDGNSTQSATRYTKIDLQNKSSVLFAGATASVSFEDDTLILSVQGVETRISANDGYYYIANAPTNKSSYYVGAFPIRNPLVIKDVASTKIDNAILQAYEAQKNDLSANYNYSGEENQNIISTKFVSESSTPTLNDYQGRVGQAGYLVRPTQIEQFAGSIYRVTNTTTSYL
jgi:hypothetical protein